MISYSARAAKALGYLKRRYNDVEIFVEDTSSHTMWLKLLRNLLPAKVRLESVNLMWGKRRVIEACKLDQTDDGRKKLYIIDGDFDFLLGKRKPRLKYLYRVGAYCIENVMVHPRCIAEVCCDYDHKIRVDNVLNELEYEKLIGRHEEMLRSLFVVYAASQAVGSGVETVGYSIHRLVSRNQGLHEFDKQKIAGRIKEVIRQSVKKVGLKLFSMKRKELKTRSGKLVFDKIVSGKDCILPIVWLRMRSHHNYRGNLEILKVHLAKEFRPEYDPALARRLRDITS
jgi:hypothetical protein